MIIHNRLNKAYVLNNKIKKISQKLEKQIKKEENQEVKTSLKTRLKSLLNRTKIINKYVNNKKHEIRDIFKENNKKNKIRELRKECVSKKNIISVFDSALTRTMGLTINEISEDIMIVQTYFFDIIENIIINGYMYKNQKYICFTASAGQIRTKKTVFIKESVFKKHQKTLMCGLTIDKINKNGGVNINKYLAYLALCNSATDLWSDFDINKSIVVEDMDTMVKAAAEFIDEKTYEIHKPMEQEILISHTDGCGMILPSKSKKSFMVRLPWIKGLLVPFPFDTFIRKKIREDNKKYSNCMIVKDIYGKEHDILKEEIEVIFTKSQFKMYKYYKNKVDKDDNVIEHGWDIYKRYFEKYKCQAGKCNEEEDDFAHAKINYQMMQTLVDMTDEELKIVSEKTKDKILKLGKDKNTMLKVLGVMDSNKQKNYYQQVLEIYPELLNDAYSKEMLKQLKKKLVKEGKSARLDIEGKYTFICPDLYAFCEFLFLDEKNPQGLLKDGDVYCSLYKNSPKLDCLRSPHLFREHAVRNNIIDDENKKWFVTKGLYTSVHDVISKILMFDNDGDKSLVCADKTIIKVAERNMKEIYPLSYNMAKAEPTQINEYSIYCGLKSAYTGGNIGSVSNNITKIWNSEDINIDAIKLLCMENNFVIDYAKTLYKPKRPKDINGMITKYTKLKTPHFFIYAKDKEKKQVEKINNSVVNRLCKIIPNPTLSFKSNNIGHFDYKILKSNKDLEIELDNEIIKKYNELDLNKRFMGIGSLDDLLPSDELYLYKDIRQTILEINNNEKYVVDVLIEYLYKNKKSSYKATLWNSFGDIILKNIQNNLEHSFDYGYTQCEVCGKRIEQTSNRKKYCNDCWKEKQRELWRENKKKHRSVQV